MTNHLKFDDDGRITTPPGWDDTATIETITFAEYVERRRVLPAIGSQAMPPASHYAPSIPRTQGVLDGAASLFASEAKRAVDSLIRVHADTGIDLARWPELLPLIRRVYPDFVPIAEEDRTVTEATLAYQLERWPAMRREDYSQTIEHGRDTFTGAADWKVGA